MAAPNPSIQSFFQPDETCPKRLKGNRSPLAIGDGFTAEKVKATVHQPTLPKWQPRGTYEAADIATLGPGPGCVAIVGRVVNYHHIETPSKAPYAAKGCINLVVKDDSAAMVVSSSFHLY